MTTPTQYAQEVERIRARRAIAQQLAQQAANTDLGSTQMAGRIAIARSPLEGLAQLAQSYQSGRIRRQSEQAETEAATKRAAETQAALATMNNPNAANVPSWLREQEPEMVAGADEAARLPAMQTLMDPEDIAKQQTVSRERATEFAREQVARKGERAEDVDVRAAEREQDAKIQAKRDEIEQDWRAGESAKARQHEKELERMQLQKDEARAGLAENRAVQSMRKEFRNLPTVKDYEDVLPLLESLKGTPDTPAGDLDFAYGVGKILDPGSVIKEGELKLTQNAAPWLVTMIGEARKQFQNKGRMPPEMRKDFLDVLEQRVGSYRKGYQRDRAAFETYARESGYDPGLVIGPDLASAYTEAKPKTEEAAAAAPPPNLLKAGVIRTFKGKEGKWTLGPDGQPKRVD